MVRLINKNNVGVISNVAFSILKMQEKLTYIREFNNPNVSPCIYENQFCVHGLPERGSVNILISNSLDGEIVAQVCEKWGFQVCRGSANRKGSVSSTLKMLSKLKNGESVAIMVDGPRGPLHEVKPGTIVLAREANVPIVPVHWISSDKTFKRLPSWDKMACPVGPCRILNVYGSPIYVGDRDDKEVAQEIKNSLLDLAKDETKKFNEAVSQGLWKRKK